MYREVWTGAWWWDREAMGQGWNVGQVKTALRPRCSSTIISLFLSCLLQPSSVHLHKFHLKRTKLKLRKNTLFCMFEAHLIFSPFTTPPPEFWLLSSQETVNFIKVEKMTEISPLIVNKGHVLWGKFVISWVFSSEERARRDQRGWTPTSTGAQEAKQRDTLGHAWPLCWGDFQYQHF